MNGMLIQRMNLTHSKTNILDSRDLGQTGIVHRKQGSVSSTPRHRSDCRPQTDTKMDSSKMVGKIVNQVSLPNIRINQQTTDKQVSVIINNLISNRRKPVISRQQVASTAKKVPLMAD